MSPVSSSLGDAAAETLTMTSNNSHSSGLAAYTYFLSYMYKPMGIFIALASIGLGMLYKHQDKLLYFPSIQGLARATHENPAGYRSPAEHSHHFETHFITATDGVTVHSWLIFPKHHVKNTNNNPNNNNTNRRPTIVFFHGNAGNIGLRLPNALQMCDILNVNVLLVEYRGFGNSPDKQTDGTSSASTTSKSTTTTVVQPNEAGMKLDAEAVWRYCCRELSDIDPTQIFVFGRSLGGAVGFHLAEYAEQMYMQQQSLSTTKPTTTTTNTNYPPLAGLMVENTFLSISDMVDQVLPFLSPIKSFVLTLDWNSLTKAQSLKRTSVLYLAGQQDELVPPSHMITLYDTSRENAKSQSQPHSNTKTVVHFHAVPDGTHNDTFMKGGKPYWTAMKKFMQEALALSSAVQGNVVGNGPASSMTTTSSATATTTSNANDASTASTTGNSNSIPIMPGNIFGMAKEAVTGNNAGSGAGKVDEEAGSDGLKKDN